MRLRPTSIAAIIAAATLASTAFAQPPALKVVDELKIGGNGGWDYITLDTTANTVFVAHGTEVSAFDLKTRKATQTLVTGSGLHVALPVNDGKDLLVTHGKSNLVTRNDAVSGVEKLRLATDAKPDAAIVEPKTGLVFVMANEGNAVDVIDLKTGQLSKHIAVPGAAEGAAVDGQGLVFTHLEDTNAFVVIDATTLQVKSTFDIKDCAEPSGMAFTPERRLILSACKNGIARVSEADTGKEVAKLPIGPRPDAALYDANAHLGYVPTADGKLTVIDFKGKPRVVATVTTRPGARTATLDPTTGRVYLPVADLGATDPTTGRPAIIPDTFRVLVVGK